MTVHNEPKGEEYSRFWESKMRAYIACTIAGIVCLLWIAVDLTILVTR